jgi:putative transposase
MPRRARGTSNECAYHVLNRTVRRSRLFRTRTDYLAFENVLCEALQRIPIRLLAYCAMPNHWHLVVWPSEAHQLSRFMHWMTGTHAQRWHLAHRTVGTGPVYQGRFKAVPLRSDTHLLWACRYVERNPLRAGLVTQAHDWRWSSLWRRHHSVEKPMLAEWPVSVPCDWLNYVNRAHTEAELAAQELFNGRTRGRGRPRKTS